MQQAGEHGRDPVNIMAWNTIAFSVKQANVTAPTLTSSSSSPPLALNILVNDSGETVGETFITASYNSYTIE
jgi:hypothetical protein